jgi:hypothetical protein
VFEKKMVRRLFGLLREKVKGGRKNQTLCNFLNNALTKLCCIDEMEEELEGLALRKKEMRKAYKYFGRKI